MKILKPWELSGETEEAYKQRLFGVPYVETPITVTVQVRYLVPWQMRLRILFGKPITIGALLALDPDENIIQVNGTKIAVPFVLPAWTRGHAQKAEDDCFAEMIATWLDATPDRSPRLKFDEHSSAKIADDRPFSQFAPGIAARARRRFLNR